MKSKITLIINRYKYLFIIVIIVVVVTIFKNLNIVKVDNTIKLSDIFTLIITSIFGVYIGYSLQKNLNSHKFEIELYYSKLTLILTYTKQLTTFNEIDEFKFYDTVAIFKNINSNFTEIKELNSFTNSLNKNELQICQDSINVLKYFITGKDLKNNCFTFNVNDKNYINKQIKIIDRQVYKLIIANNRN